MSLDLQSDRDGSMNRLKIIHRLTMLANREVLPRYSRYGICNEISDLFEGSFPERMGAAQEMVKDLSSQWEKWSGSKNHPVPHPVYGASYAYISDRIELWAEDEYGDNRRELCSFLANKLSLGADMPTGR